MVEGDAGAHGDAFHGVVGDVAGDADLLGDEAVEVAEEGGATGEDGAAVDDAGGEARAGGRSRTARTAPTMDWRASWMPWRCRSRRRGGNIPPQRAAAARMSAIRRCPS